MLNRVLTKTRGYRPLCGLPSSSSSSAILSNTFEEIIKKNSVRIQTKVKIEEEKNQNKPKENQPF